MSCPNCGVDLPNQAVFCPMCAVQVRCKSCREVLIRGARACIHCGTFAGEGLDGTKDGTNGSHAINKITLEETTKRRSLRAELTDVAIQTVGDSFGLLIGNRLRQPIVPKQAALEGQLALPEFAGESEGADPEVIAAGFSDNQRIPLIDAKELAGTDGDIVKIIQSHLDSSAHPELLNANGLLEKSLHVLKIAKDEFNVDGLTSFQIAQILTVKFRITASRQGVSSALDRVSDLVNRVSSDTGAIRYMIMAPGGKYLLDPTSYAPRHVPRSRATKRSNTRRSAKSNGDEQLEKKGSEQASAKRSGLRPGPKKVVMDLVSDGYFSAPRIIGEIKEHLKDQCAHSFETNELSPVLFRLVRDKVLSRAKRDDGQYEYTTK